MSKRLIILLVATFSSPLYATVFKCSNIDGVISFQDQPCLSYAIEEVIALPATAAGPISDDTEANTPDNDSENDVKQAEPSDPVAADNL